VFERSSYPDSLLLEHTVSFEPSSRTAIVDIDLPDLSGVTNVTGFKVVRGRNEIVANVLKPKDHAALYDSVVRQIVLKTMHEVYESDYAENAHACVVNGFVDTVDRATGKDVRACIISVGSERKQFSAFDLSRIAPEACIKKLKGLVAGPLSEIQAFGRAAVRVRHVSFGKRGVLQRARLLLRRPDPLRGKPSEPSTLHQGTYAIDQGGRVVGQLVGMDTETCGAKEATKALHFLRAPLDHSVAAQAHRVRTVVRETAAPQECTCRPSPRHRRRSPWCSRA
jgi:hypothetical protein